MLHQSIAGRIIGLQTYLLLSQPKKLAVLAFWRMRRGRVLTSQTGGSPNSTALPKHCTGLRKRGGQSYNDRSVRGPWSEARARRSMLCPICVRT